VLSLLNLTLYKPGLSHLVAVHSIPYLTMMSGRPEPEYALHRVMSSEQTYDEQLKQ